MQPAPVTIQPLDDKLLVKPYTEKERTDGGIYLPETALQKQNWGEVLAIGGMVNNPIESPDEIHVGDKIAWAKYSGTEFTLSNQEFHLIPRKTVLGKVEKLAEPSAANN